MNSAFAIPLIDSNDDTASVASAMRSPGSTEALAHFLRIAGLGQAMADGRLILIASEGTLETEGHVRDGAVAIVLDPTDELLSRMSVSSVRRHSAEWRATYLLGAGSPFGHLRGFGDTQTFAGDGLERIAVTSTGECLWSWRPAGRGGFLLIGSDLPSDIVRFRQGDPHRIARPKEKEAWGYSGERPNYLFEGIIDKARPRDRPCDWLVFALVDFVRRKAGITADAVLPGGAACALVITGDTDGATGEHYSRQRELLGDLPITYFLRPACAASAAVLKRLEQDERVDLQLHPDALDRPSEYGRLLDEQILWFTGAVGRPPDHVRNHGYLNDGYWRHAPHWLRNHVRWSANLPGVDGLVLNGSLLPGRLSLEGAMTTHWSLVTPYGDGMMFAFGLSGEEAGRRIEAHVHEIIQSGVPGVVALNLHPANVADTSAMHDVLHRLTHEGVLAWSMHQCARWFEQIDAQK